MGLKSDEATVLNDRYLAFQPDLQAGVKGWREVGVLDLGEILNIVR